MRTDMGMRMRILMGTGMRAQHSSSQPAQPDAPCSCAAAKPQQKVITVPWDVSFAAR